jgi:uncharacterized membrane protein
MFSDLLSLLSDSSLSEYTFLLYLACFVLILRVLYRVSARAGRAVTGSARKAVHPSFDRACAFVAVLLVAFVAAQNVFRSPIGDLLLVLVVAMVTYGGGVQAGSKRSRHRSRRRRPAVELAPGRVARKPYRE